MQKASERRWISRAGGERGVMTQRMTLETWRVKNDTGRLVCRLFPVCVFRKKCTQIDACTCVCIETSAAVFVYACACTSCCDLVTVVRLSIRPAGLEEAEGSTAVVLLVPLKPPLPSPFNISSQHSCRVQLSRVHPREDECAVTMLVENILYKCCTGP